MEFYGYLYGSEEGAKIHRNVTVISEEEEKTAEGKNGWCITLDKVPLAFMAYAQWAWHYFGPMGTNILFKISPYHWWGSPPTFTTLSHQDKAQYEFLVVAFHKRIVNEHIRQQQHKLYASLNTCEAENKSSLTRTNLSIMLTHIKSCLEVEKGNYYPTPPPPEKCNYNKFIVYERQRRIIKNIRKMARRRQRRLGK